MKKKIIKYLAYLILSAVFLVPLLTLRVGAQGTTATNDPALSAFLGDQHAYSVTIKHNDSIAVLTRIVFANSTDKAKSDYTLGLPDGLSGEVLGIQQILGRECTKRNPTADTCLEFTAPDYWNYQSNNYNLNESNEYKKATVTKSGNDLKITLPVPVESGGGSAVILSYYQTGQVKSGLFGAKTLNFKSLADPSTVKNVYVNVSSDSDIYTSEGRSTVSSTSATDAATSLTSSAVGTASMDKLSTAIGYSYGSLISKNGSDLTPNEQFEVTAKYSANWFGMYWKTLAITLLVLIAVITLATIVLKRPTHRNGAKLKNESTSASSSVRENISFRDAITWKEALASLAILLVGIGLPIFFSYLINLMSNTSIYVELISVLLFLFGSVVIIGYLVFRGVRYGFGAAMASFLFYVIWLIVAFVIFAATLPADAISTSTASGIGTILN